jgi:hypothetical protein
MREKHNGWPFTLAILAFLACGAGVGAIVNKAKAQPTAILPTATSTTGVTTGAAVQVIGVNPSRRSIQICSFSNSANLAPVNPSGMTAVTPSATVGIPVASGACFTPPSLLTASGTSGGMGAAWQAIGVSGTASITVLEY